jgi:hypothetical protein
LTLSSNSDKRASQMSRIISSSCAASVYSSAICHNYELRNIKDGWCYAKYSGYWRGGLKADKDKNGRQNDLRSVLRSIVINDS